jgi:hypothetical protein
MWDSIKDTHRAETCNQHVIQGITRDKARALMEGKGSKTLEGAIHFVDTALRHAMYALTIPKARPDLNWSENGRADAAWRLFRNIVTCEMKDTEVKIQWATAIECEINSEKTSQR